MRVTYAALPDTFVLEPDTIKETERLVGLKREGITGPSLFYGNYECKNPITILKFLKYCDVVTLDRLKEINETAKKAESYCKNNWHKIRARKWNMLGAG